MKISHNKIAKILCFAIVLAFLPNEATKAETVTATTHSFAGKVVDGERNTWIFSTPTVKDTISWSSGDNFADGDKFIKKIYGPEFKFDFTCASPPCGKTFSGFSRTDSGSLGSVTKTKGTGSSSKTPGFLFGTNYEATWEVEADGHVSSAPGATGYFSTATGVDPFNITPQQLEEVGIENTESSWDLLIPIGINNIKHSFLGSTEISVNYLTEANDSNLLKILIDKNGIFIGNNTLLNPQLFILNSINEIPDVVNEPPINFMTLKERLETDLSLDNSLDNPIFLGIFLDNIPVPRIDLGDETVAKIFVSSKVTQAESVPEPTNILGLGMIVGFGILFKKEYLKKKKA